MDESEGSPVLWTLHVTWKCQTRASRSLTFSEVSTTWRMQGSDEDYRCTNGNWVPLSGPGYDGGFDGYLAACPSGYSCIQGRPTNLRDAPVSGTYSNGSLPATTLLTWSGSNTGTYSHNCSRDALIPSDRPGLFVEQLWIR